MKLKITIKLYFRKKPQTFKNTWILKISMNKHGKILATCFKSRKQKKQQKTMSFTESVFSQETVAGVMTSPLEAENISFTKPILWTQSPD